MSILENYKNNSILGLSFQISNIHSATNIKPYQYISIIKVTSILNNLNIMYTRYQSCTLLFFYIIFKLTAFYVFFFSFETKGDFYVLGLKVDDGDLEYYGDLKRDTKTK